VIGGSGGYAVFTVGDDEYEATPGSIPQDVRSETGYQKTERRYDVESTAVSVAGLGRTIDVRTSRTVYDKPLDTGFGSFRIANVTVIATPSVRILGEERNPLAGSGHEQLATRVEAESDGVSNLEPTGETTASMLGETVTVGRYEGENRSSQFPIEVSIVARIGEPIEHAGDYVSVVCVYPTFIEDTERENTSRIIESTEHGQSSDTGAPRSGSGSGS
jgi:hypothetical protein